MSERTYIVTLRERGDLESFYDEMEFPGSSSAFVPTRSVKCRVRRSISRNTHYNLTPEEAVQLAKDPRVLAVELPPEDMGIIRTPHASYTRSGTFSKSSAQHFNFNWGHLHCGGTALQRRKNNWGYDTTNTVNDTVTIWEDGKDVDVVIVDGGVVSGHPEYNSDEDGTSGDDRVVEYQWFNELNTIVNGLDNDLQTEPTGTIPYTDGDYHGMHVAGIAAGSLRGWAPQANIYNLNIFPSNSSLNVPTLLIFDYLRAFHQNKPVNPKTGLRNPTVTNHSWGIVVKDIVFDETQAIYDISAIYYRGTTYNSSSPGPSGWTNQGIKADFGLNANASDYTVRIPVRSASMDADIQDAIEDGIIIISSAGNDNTMMDIVGGTEYNNYITVELFNDTRTTSLGTFNEYYMRGSSPAAATGVICVGSQDNHSDFRRSSFSNYGPRVDFYAPGSYIPSAFNDFSYVAAGGTALNLDDPRNTAWDLGVFSGTSMASPQVSGIVACYLTNRDYRVSTSEVLDYLSKYTVDNDMTVTGSGYSSTSDLGGGPNKYVTAVNPKPESGVTMLSTYTKGKRPSNGPTFPRRATFTQTNLSQYVFHILEDLGEYSYIIGRDDFGFGSDSGARQLELSAGRDLKIVKEDTTPLYLQYYYPTGTIPTIQSSNGPSSGVDGQGAYNGSPSGDALEWTNVYAGMFALGNSSNIQSSISVGGAQIFNVYLTNNGATSYFIEANNTSTDRNGTIPSGTVNPTINVKRGDVVVFNMNANGHPLWIKTAAVTGGSSTINQCPDNGTAVGPVVWNTAEYAPGTYYYICQYHGSMDGEIVIS